MQYYAEEYYLAIMRHRAEELFRSSVDACIIRIVWRPSLHLAKAKQYFVEYGFTACFLHWLLMKGSTQSRR
jgi:hypothetical protein